MRTFRILCAALALASCGKEKVVSVPVPIACVKASDIPAEPARVASEFNGNWNHDGPIIAVLALDLRDYAGKLRALLHGCE